MKKDDAKIEDAVVITDAKTEIAKFNLADAGIAELKKKYKGLKVKDKDDQNGITKVTEAYRDVVKVRTTLEKKRKEVKEPYVKIGKDIDEEAKRLTNLILEVENPLKSEYEKIKQWEKEEEERKEAERQEKIKKRVGELTGAGLVFNGEFYVINEISMDIVTIEKMSEADYDFLLAKVKIEKKKNDEAEAKAKADKEAEAKKQAELKAENERIAKENRDEKLEMRTEKLEALGFTKDDEKERFVYSGDGGFFEATFNFIADLSLEDFKNYVSETGGKIKENSENLEAKRKKDEEDKKEAEEKEKAEKLERLPDLEKIQLYTDEILKVQIPQLKNEKAGEVLAEFKNGLKLLIDDTLSKVKKLQ